MLHGAAAVAERTFTIAQSAPKPPVLVNGTAGVTGARRRMGRTGAWLNNAITASAPADVQRRELSRIERLGYGSAWTGETPGGRDIFVKRLREHLAAGADHVLINAVGPYLPAIVDTLERIAPAVTEIQP
jgi:hypothetical protein